jgi:hypothetical protein
MLMQGVFKPPSQGVTHSLAAAGGVPGCTHADAPAVDMRPLADSSNVYVCVFPGLHSHDAATRRLSNSLAQTLGGAVSLLSFFTSCLQCIARSWCVVCKHCLLQESHWLAAHMLLLLLLLKWCHMWDWCVVCMH